MKEKNTVTEVQDKIRELTDKRSADYRTIEEQLEETRRQASVARQAVEDATKEMDLSAYKQALNGLQEYERTE